MRGETLKRQTMYVRIT